MMEETGVSEQMELKQVEPEQHQLPQVEQQVQVVVEQIVH